MANLRNRMTNELQIQMRFAGYEGEFDLSSLVDACGDRFVSLTKGMFPNQWMCVGGTLEKPVKVGGKSDEEAVAKLWLALNKKK